MSVPTNHSGIEMQLIRKFSTNQQVLWAFLQSNDQDIQDILGTHLIAKGTLKNKSIPEYDFLDQQTCSLLPTLKEGYLTSNSISMIDMLMKEKYGEQYTKTLIIHQYSKRLRLRGDIVGSKGSLNSSSSMVLVEKDGCKVPALLLTALK